MGRAQLAVDCTAMKRIASAAILSIPVLAAVVLFGSATADHAVASDRSKGAKCAEIDDPTARLACFDAAFPRPPRTGTPKPAAPAPASGETVAAPAAAPDKPVSEERKFGLSEKQKAKLEPKPAEPELTTTTAGVKTARKLPTGYWRVVLDNDQIWQQTELDPNIWLRPGDQVTIRRAAMGSYLLVTPSNYSTRVRRLQ